MPDANLLVPLALGLWIPLTLFFFSRLHPAIAASIAMVGATILLPSGYSYDLKGLPAIDRELVGILGALLGCLVYARGRLAWPGRGYGVDLLAAGMIVGGLLTAYTNAQGFQMGGKYLPGTPIWAGVSRAAGTLLTFWLPLYLGRALFRSPRDLRMLLVVLAVAGVFYALPVLWESRMSPQLHKWVYGYVPASFGQAKRSTGWGWRPMAFVGHGLALAQFLSICVLSIAALWRMKVRIAGFAFGPALGWVYFVLLMCQSLAAIVYATVVAPLIAFVGLRWHRYLLASLLALTFTYPALRAADVFPTDQFVSTARMWSESRANSLNFRFENEDLLLERARERLWLGWGGFGRERIYDERGKSETVSDGYWVIVMGQLGVVGYVCSFGMILIPAVVAVWALGRRRDSADAMTVLTVAWIITLTAVDLLPNGFLTPRTLFAGGAMLGAVGGWRRRPARRASPETRRAPADRASPERREPAAQGSPERDASLGSRLRRGKLPVAD